MPQINPVNTDEPGKRDTDSSWDDRASTNGQSHPITKATHFWYFSVLKANVQDTCETNFRNSK